MITSSYQTRFDQAAHSWLDSLNACAPLKEAAKYALLSKGKRVRPSICFMVAEEVGSSDVSLAALAIELFHTASLIADDLPCMDDDAERRARPTLHKAFNEPLALLTSYSMIAAGFECLAKQAKEGSFSSEEANKRALLAIENVSINTGVFGACGGQLLDLFPPDTSIETLKEIRHKKTGVLFEISFVLGWLFGGGALSSLEEIKRCAYHFGQAFQLFDDLGDFQQDLAANNQSNIAVLKGEETAESLLVEEIENYQASLKNLGLAESKLASLTQDLTRDSLSPV